MAGIKWLYITTNNKVFNVPQPKDFKFKAIKELSDQEVLRVMLFYHTTDRKPTHLELIEFARITLDTDGAYNGRDMNKIAKLYDEAFSTPQSLAEQENPFSLPLAPVIPTLEEKNCLYDYLDKKFPLLKKTAPIIAERAISKSKQIHQGKIDKIKEASKIRKRA